MFSYENLEVYKKAYHANQKVYRLLKLAKPIPSFTKNQFGKASLSIMLNIADGSAKFSNRDRRNFYVTARGSAFECSSIVCFLYDEGEIAVELKNELYVSCQEISKMLFAMIKHLE